MPGRELGVLGNRITFRTPRAWGRERKAAGPSTLGHPPARAPFTSSSTSPTASSRAYRRRVVDLPQHGLVPLSIRNCAAPTPQPDMLIADKGSRQRLHPRSVAPTRYPAHRPRTHRPGRPPRPRRQQRRATTRVRPARTPAAHGRRALLRPTRTPTGSVHRIHRTLRHLLASLLPQRHHDPAYMIGRPGLGECLGLKRVELLSRDRTGFE